MRILVDTNVLLRIAEPTHAAHQIASDAVRALREHELLIVPQTIYEFWAVATRTVTANGLGKTPEYAEDLLPKFFSVFRLLRDERSIYETWLQLVTRESISGVKSYDARLAAAMIRHNITHLLTYNPKDFRRFGHVTVLDPDQVIRNSAIN